MTDKLNIGIIGTGRIGQVHANNLCAMTTQVNVVAVTDVVTASAKECASRCGIKEVAADYRQILEAPSIDAVIICTPTDTHAQLIIDAAQAGKHIFCEKPVALDLKRIDQAIAAVEAGRVKCQIGFNRRFDTGFKHARDMVAEGKIGTPHLVRITSRDPEPPPLQYIAVSGGLFRDMTIHDFDMSRFILGEDPGEIYAVGGCLVDDAIKAAGDIDTAVITLSYPSGAFGVIDNSRQAVYGYDQRLEVFGSEGCIMVGNRQPYESTYYSRHNTESPKPLYFFLERYNESYQEEMRQFVDAIVNDRPPLVTSKDGKQPVIMALAAQQSMLEHQPVKIERK